MSLVSRADSEAIIAALNKYAESKKQKKYLISQASIVILATTALIGLKFSVATTMPWWGIALPVLIGPALAISFFLFFSTIFMLVILGIIIFTCVNFAFTEIKRRRRFRHIQKLSKEAMKEATKTQSVADEISQLDQKLGLYGPSGKVK